MKKIRMIALAAFAAVSMSVSAQEPFQTFYFQYNPSSLKYSHDGHSISTSYNVISLGYSYAMPIASIPLYLEFGGAAQWLFNKETIGNHDVKTNIVGLKVPINAIYSFDITDAISIRPYAGLYGRVNIIGKSKTEGHDSVDLFDGDDGLKRFQLGLNGGCRVSFNNFVFAGIGYYYDLMKCYEHTHFEGFDITVGLIF